MDSQTYRDHVETRVLDHDYEPVPSKQANPFEPVWYKAEEDPTIGRTKVFVTVSEKVDPDSETVETSTDAFRTLLSSASLPTDGSIQNLFGYIVFPAHSPAESLLKFATEEYTVADRRTNVFPLVYDLDSETLHSHSVPRLKGRGFYEKQKIDAEELLIPADD